MKKWYLLGLMLCVFASCSQNEEPTDDNEINTFSNETILNPFKCTEGNATDVRNDGRTFRISKEGGVFRFEKADNCEVGYPEGPRVPVEALDFTIYFIQELFPSMNNPEDWYADSDITGDATFLYGPSASAEAKIITDSFVYEALGTCAVINFASNTTGKARIFQFVMPDVVYKYTSPTLYIVQEG